MFEQLGNATFLKGCESVATQNQCESFNHLVWTMARKDVYNSTPETSLAINTAVGIYNDGFRATIKSFFESAHIPITSEMSHFWYTIDKGRMKRAAYANKDSRKARRKDIRRKKHQRVAAFQHKEGIEYKSSFFYQNEKPLNNTSVKKKRNCPSCGSGTHQRSSNKLCPNFKKRKSSNESGEKSTFCPTEL